MQPGKVARIKKGYYNTASLYQLSGRGAVRLARLHGVQEVGGSNPLAPTIPTVKGCKIRNPSRFGGDGGWSVAPTVPHINNRLVRTS